MGLFSEDCKRCAHPALSAMATNNVNAWMNEIVAIWPTGDLTVGTYGGVDEVDYVIGAAAEYGQGNTIYHRACWEMAGKPTRYGGPCRPSEDQGWFFDAGAHDLPDPRLAAWRQHSELRLSRQEQVHRGERQVHRDAGGLAS